ncbi:hypothetical protein [Curtobacterium sp. NPDC089991]|uniref:hypothetical protein n=1 Tax=Curtobacterium sp. NPDC089991 TaxID=3363969 RepID=UPI0038117006
MNTFEKVATAFVGVAALLLPMSPPVPAAAAAAAAAATGSARFGIGSGIDTTADGAKVALAAGLGVGTARVDLWWTGVEKARDELVMPASYRKSVDRLRAAGIRPLIVLDYGNPHHDGGGGPTTAAGIAAFARYAGFVAATFGPDVAGYEIWNEWPNTVAPEARSAARYVALTRAASAAVHAAAPGSVVAGPAMSLLGADGLHPWLRQWLAAGGPATVDAVSVHAYTGTRPPETTLGPAMRELRTALTAQHRSVPVWWTEGGWQAGPLGQAGTVTPAVQSAWLVRWGALAAHLGVTLVVPFTLNDAGSTPTGYGLYGSASGGYTARRAAAAYAVLVRTVGDRRFVAVERAGTGGVWIVRYGSGGDVVRVLWSTSGVRTTSVGVPGGSSLVSATGATSRLTVVRGAASVRVRAAPVFLRSDR